MRESEITLSTSDGAMPCFVVHPDRGGPFPVVLMFMDGLGMREALRDLARRLATSGYYVMLPDLYYRAGKTQPIELGAPDAMDQIMKLVRSVTPDRAMNDATVCLAHAASDPSARDGAIGTMGYCMGGRLAVVSAQALGDRVAAAVSCHPGFLDAAIGEFAASDLSKIRGFVYVGAADNDQTFTTEARNQLEALLSQHGVAHEIELQRPEAVHGYMVAGERFDRAASDLVWSRALALFGTRL